MIPASRAAAPCRSCCATVRTTAAPAAAIRSKRAGVWRTLAWSEVNRRVRQYAAGLAAAGLKRGEVIAFVTENCEEQFMLQIAALASVRAWCAPIRTPRSMS